ncbi:uncharacterized protein GLRG_09657 [Colletotrichum graminicola M1.001]|uniref:Zn(2)-C6 fungal-type domain-containing protein n=1 Tax=Colletotrichum graminicola (strain M1.001 / M2 / FGSC 10212) TaxID=645133 RepID=E3QUH5_COLGM|nr:uncharacterized protein GLRG_09657 [Colletotrichum graminicola M1.001]EFQ34513.1 hypothetical protein GLRG_09657 [Colletotrichum graminicola M1.001]
MRCRPLASCFACRTSKVKCDLQKPSCRRCEGRGKPCPGYADPWAVAHRSENATAALQVELRIAKRLKEREAPSDAASIAGGGKANSLAAAAGESVRRRSTVPKQLQVDSEFVWLERFYSNYACADETAWFSLLAGLRASRTTSAAFEGAIRATALASCAMQTRQAGLMVLARRYYGSAIAKINSALQNPTTAQDDSVAVALLAMCIYEGLIPEEMSPKAVSHCKGSLMILRYRADQGVASSLDSRILAFVAHIGVLQVFAGGERRDLLFPVVKSASWTRHAVVEPLLARAVEFKGTVDSVMTSIKSREAPITGILQTGLDIIRDLEAAANYRIMSPGPRKTSRQTGAMGEESNNFNNLLSRSSYATEAALKGLYLTVRLQVIEFILNLSMAHGEPTCEELGILTSLPHGLTAVEQICEQVRVLFGFDGREPASRNQGIAFNAWCMLWPMITVLQSGFTDRETQLWMMDKLTLIGGLAERSVYSGVWTNSRV